MITVSGLYYYPIKSCRGVAVERAPVTPRGLADDRMLMVVDEVGEFMTQRDHPRMALVAPVLRDEVLGLSGPGMPSLDVRMRGDGPRRAVRVWSDTCAAVDQGEAAAAWLSEFLGARCRLVRLADEHARRVDARFARRPDDQTSFSDGYPFLLTSEASLDDLNSRMAVPLPMNRFRPNIVVRGCAPFAEDGWADIEVANAHGPVRFGVVKPCARCAITTTDQATAERGLEPLRTLVEFRRRADGKVMFAQNLVLVRGGVIAVGDAVTPLAMN